MNAVLYKPSGAVYAVLKGGTENTLLEDANSMGYPCVITEDSVEIDTHYVANGELFIIPEKPSGSYVFDYASGQWELSIEDAKSKKWDEVKTARDAEEFGTFVWNGYTFDCNEVSQRRIQGAVQLAQLDSAMFIDWTLSDNSAIALSAADVIAVGQALAVHVNACHVKGRGLRDQINAAQTEAELSVITW